MGISFLFLLLALGYAAIQQIVTVDKGGFATHLDVSVRHTVTHDQTVTVAEWRQFDAVPITDDPQGRPVTCQVRQGGLLTEIPTSGGDQRYDYVPAGDPSAPAPGECTLDAVIIGWSPE